MKNFTKTLFYGGEGKDSEYAMITKTAQTVTENRKKFL